jgi:outer membrane protein assembly factor BamB
MRLGRVCSVMVATTMAAALGIPAATAASPVWRREPGGRLEAIAAKAGTVYVTGEIRTGARAWSLVVAKFRPSGALDWRRTWRVQKHDWHAAGRSLVVAPDGGVLVGGSSGYGEGGDALLLRYSPDGRLLWERTIPTEQGHARIVGLAVLGDRVIAAVTDQGCCAIWDHDGYVQAFGLDGSLSWRTQFEVRGVPPGTWDSVAALVARDGWIVVAGEVDRGYWRDDAGPLPDEDLALMALDAAGRVRWTRVLGDGPTGPDGDRATDVDMRGRLLIVTGSMMRTRYSGRAWVGAFGLDGHRRWTRRFIGEANAVSVAPWGAVYVGEARWSNDGPEVSRLRGYAPHGDLLRSRPVGTGPEVWITDVAAARSVYVTWGRQLQRWRR